jgi:hypothetical protein
MVVGVTKPMIGGGSIEFVAQAHCGAVVTCGCECGGNFAKSVGATTGVMKDSEDVQFVKGSSSSDQEWCVSGVDTWVCVRISSYTLSE